MLGRRHSAAVLLSAILLAAGTLASCGVIGQDPSTHGPTAAPGGLTRDAAIARARELANATGASTVVVWASIESDPFVSHGNATPDALTWVVRLQGGLTPSPCPSGFLDVPAAASSPPCLDREGGLDVVIDYYAGTLLGWLH